MNKNTFVFLVGVLNEIKNSLGGVVLLVKNKLVLNVLPLEGEISYSSALEVIHNLFASAIDDMRHFVRHYEFLILFVQSHFIRAISKYKRLYLPMQRSYLQ